MPSILMHFREHQHDEEGLHEPDECEVCIEKNQSYDSSCRCGLCCEQLIIEVSLRDSEREPKINEKGSPIFCDITGTNELIGWLLNSIDGLPPSSCFIGVSFFRPLGSSSTLRTSVVQAFDENGDGLVLRGHRFDWDEQRNGKSPHLSEHMAEELVTMVLDRYEQERGQRPQRVVVHKSSRFDPEERFGFEDALRGIGRYDLVSLCPTSDLRLLRSGQYPPLRGTAFHIGDNSYCYTSGYLSYLERYPHGHVPSPLQIADHVGDTPRTQLLREIMILTKMNWNSANMGGLMPITLRFSRLVGDILREVPDGQIPQPKYKFYM